MKKKVAILLRGHIRNYEVLNLCIKNLEHFLVNENPNYDFYFFLQTWSFLDWDHDNTPYKNVRTDAQLIKEIKDDIIIGIDEFDLFLDRTHSQYKIIYRSNVSKSSFEEKNNTKFDIVLSTRPDLIINSKFNLDDINVNTFTLTHDDGWFGDWFCISSSPLMDYYADLYNNIPDLETEIRTKGIFNNYNPDPHALLVLHLLKGGFCFSLEAMIELRMSDKLPSHIFHTNLEQYYIDYYIKRVDGRQNAVFKKAL